MWACLRTIEAFGIQNVDVVLQTNLYRGKAALSQKRGLRTAMGSAQWLTLSQYPSTTLAIEALRRNGRCRIFAADLHPTAVDIRSVQWDIPINHSEQYPRNERNDKESTTTNEAVNSRSDEGLDDDDDDYAICIVMGNEESGISAEMREHADVLFTLPMVGFAESFNLSVATAITLAHLSATSGSNNRKGPLRPGDLTRHEQQCLLLKGLLTSLPQKRMANAMLRQAGIVLPPELCF